MTKVVISGTGVFTPPYSISNEELVDTFNAYVRKYNEENAAAIERGEMEPLQESSVEFIVKASGIESRYVMNKSGIVDPDIMAPRLRQRSNDEPSILAEMAVDAAKKAMARANKTPADIDAVLVACSNLERPYPAIAVEVQELLGIEGFGFDMNVACSSATFGIQTAYDMLRSGSVDCVLIVDPEICSGQLPDRAVRDLSRRRARRRCLLPSCSHASSPSSQHRPTFPRVSKVRHWSAGAAAAP